MKFVLTVLVMTSFTAFAANDTYQESLYYNFQNVIIQESQTQTKNRDANKTAPVIAPGFTSAEQSLFVDALWDLTEEERHEAFTVLDQLQAFQYSLVDRLRIQILRMKYRGLQTMDAEMKEEIENNLRLPKPTTKLIYTIAAFQELFKAKELSDLVELASKHKSFKRVSNSELKSITDDSISDIFYNSPANSVYGNGEYSDTIKLFMFCRYKRRFPCMMVMRDATGAVVRNVDGTIWTHPALGLAASGLPSYMRNGNTPTGVMTIDSVMPEADLPLNFGVNRRLVLNFIKKSKKEVNLKALLPSSSHSQSWWKSGTLARDFGRNFLRIHGTGKLNKYPKLAFFPFMPTNGCIAQRENTYDGVTYTDQRDLLDQLMIASGYEPTYENEESIKGILYIVELDGQMSAVTAQDLKLKGIE